MDRQRLSKLYSYPYAIIWKTRVRAKIKTRVSGGNRISTAIVQEQLQLEGQIVRWPNNFVVINDISRNASCSDDVPVLCWNGDFPEAAGHGSIPRVGITASAGCRAGLLILWNTVGSKILGIFNAKGYRLRHTEIWIWSVFPDSAIASPAFLFLPIASQDWLCTTCTWGWFDCWQWAGRKRRL